MVAKENKPHQLHSELIHRTKGGLFVNKLSSRFLELWGNENRSLDIVEYELCLNEWQSAHDKKMITKYVITILFFCAGLWALYENALFMAVLMLALAANFNLISAHHILVSETMNLQRLMAMLINKQSQNMEALRREIREEKELKSS